MSLSAAVLDALVKAGATREQLVAAMQADIAEREAAAAGREAEASAKLEKKRVGNRERQQRKRVRNAASRVTAVTTRDSRDTPPKVSPKDINQTPSSPPETSEPVGSSSLPRAWSLWPGVSLQVWDDLKRNRHRKRLPNTDTAWAKFCADVEKFSGETGIPPPELIKRCVAKGWGAIYDPREENERQQRPNTVGRHQPADGLSSTARAGLAVFGPS